MFPGGACDSGIGYELVLALDVRVLQMVEQPVDAAALAFLEEVEANDLEVEYMKLVHAGFHNSPALTERMQEVMVRRHVLRQKGSWEEEEEEEEEADASDLLPPLSSPSSSSTTEVARSRLVFFSISPRAVFFVVVGRPEMLDIKAVLDQKNSYAFFLYSGRLVLLVLFTSQCVFFLVCRPMMLGITAGMDQTDIPALVDTGSFMVKVQLLDEVVVPVVCNDIRPGPVACTVGDDFRLVSVFCVALGSTADTCGASVYKAYWKNFSLLSLKRWIAVLEVDSRLSVIPVFSAMLGSTVAGGESFSPDDAYDSAWNSVKQMKGKYTVNYFQYQDVVGCVCMHNDAPAASTIFAPTTTTTTSSKLKGKRRSAGVAVTQLS